MDRSYVGVRERVIKLGPLREERRSARAFACDTDKGRLAPAVGYFASICDAYILTVCQEGKP